MNSQKSMLQVVTHMNGDTIVEVVESREVAKVVGKNHADLIRDIRTYEKYLNEANFGLVDTESNFAFYDFFIESTYTDIRGRQRPCYLITKKGCEMIANKMTGKKGVVFTAQYVNAFHDMETKLKNPMMLNDSLRKELSEVKESLNHMVELYKDQSRRVERLENAKALEGKKFVPPTAQEVEDYCDRLGEYIDADRFVDYYQSIGWLVGNKPMKDWKATVRNWIRTQRY